MVAIRFTRLGADPPTNSGVIRYLELEVPQTR